MTSICNKCNVSKQLSEFYFRKDSGKYRADCKTCFNLQKEKGRRENIAKNASGRKGVTITEKQCTCCKKTKTITEFSIKKDSKSGVYSYCLECTRKKDRARVKPVKKYGKDDIKCCTKCRVSKNLLENYRTKPGTSDGYSNICKSCEIVYSKSVSKHAYLNKKLRLNTDIQFKIAENLRARIRAVLGDIKIIKPKTEILIGCKLDDFIKHLTNQFYSEITMDNYGEVWHLDHIVPCDWFNLVDTEHMNACTHYTNIQPLLIADNLNKSNRLEWIHPENGYRITFLRLVFSNFLELPDLVN